jgi:hypothetical protein
MEIEQSETARKEKNRKLIVEAVADVYRKRI